MFDNIGYQFSNLEELLMFVEWLTSTFDEPEDFEKFILEKMPYLRDADNSTIAITTIDAICLMDDSSDDDDEFNKVAEHMDNEVQFWQIINNEFDNEDSDGPTIPGSD